MKRSAVYALVGKLRKRCGAPGHGDLVGALREGAIMGVEGVRGVAA